MPSIINATTTNGVAISPDNSGSLQLATNNGTTAVTIDTSQNVGVGTSSPATKLHVASTSGAVQVRASSDTDVSFSATATGTDSTAFMTVLNDARQWTMRVNGAESDQFQIRDSTAGANRMVIDTSGQLGINTATPADRVTVNGNIALNGGLNYVFANGGGSSGSVNAGFGLDGTNSRLLFYTSGVGNERMRIDSSGRLLVGCTNEPNASINGFKADVAYTIIASSGQIPFYVNRNTNTGEIQQLRYNNGAVGNISTNGSNCTFNSTSDYRLKENIVPMTGALDKVAQLKPVTYTWKKDGQDGEGFIAHELAEVCPEAVTGEKDAVDEEGKPIYQAIDQSVLVATLTAAIQELKAELDTVKAELNTLKNPPVEGTE